ncbi:MAG: CopD family protein [Thermomicrobiales bacterium]
MNLLTNRRTGIALTALIILLAAAFLAGQEDAAAHAAFDRSDPPPSSILPVAPGEITIWFTEPLEFGYSRAEIYDQRGALVAGVVSEPGPDDFSLRIPLAESLERGTYSVVWNNLSTADGHTASGYFAFTVGTADDVTQVFAPIGSEDEGSPLWLQSASRWLVLLSLAAIIAIWLVWLTVLRPATANDPEFASMVQRRTWNLVLVMIVVNLAANVLALLVQAATVDGDALLDSTIDVVRDTRYGELWIARILLLAAIGVVLEWVDWAHPENRRGLSLLALGLSLSLAAPISMNAHAAALGEGRTTAIVFDWAHITAASIWFGGLALLLAGLLRSPREHGGRRQALAIAIPRFSAVALICWGMMALTGAYASWLQVGSVDALRNTDHGRSLTIKLGLVVVVLILAAINLLFITRKLDRGNEISTKKLTWSIGAEVAITVVILLMVGRMTSLQPARDVTATPVAASIEIALDLEGQPATLSIIPGIPGPNHFLLDVPGGTLSEDTEAVIELELTGGALGVNALPLERTTGNQFEWHGSELSASGDWTANVIVRSIGNFTWEGVATFPIAGGGQSDTGDAWRFSSHSIAALLLVAIGLIGLVVGWLAGAKGLRKESALLGATAVVLGFGIMATDRVEPAGAIPPRPPTTDESIVRGQETYEALCLSCHGATGQGDGPSATGLQPPPADFTDLTLHIHDDAGWYTAIVNGVPGTEMPAFGDTLSDEEIWAVVDYIQSEFQTQAPGNGQ